VRLLNPIKLSNLILTLWLTLVVGYGHRLHMSARIMTTLEVSEAHPEREPKHLDNSTIIGIAIYMVDAVGGQSPTAAAHFSNRLLKLRLGKKKLKTPLHSLKLNNSINEIISLHQWHFHTADESKPSASKQRLKLETLKRLSNDGQVHPSRLLVKYTPQKIHHSGPLNL
jgi:hypothetical protein